MLRLPLGRRGLVDGVAAAGPLGAHPSAPAGLAARAVGARDRLGGHRRRPVPAALVCAGAGAGVVVAGWSLHTAAWLLAEKWFMTRARPGVRSSGGGGGAGARGPGAGADGQCADAAARIYWRGTDLGGHWRGRRAPRIRAGGSGSPYESHEQRRSRSPRSCCRERVDSVTVGVRRGHAGGGAAAGCARHRRWQRGHLHERRRRARASRSCLHKAAELSATHRVLPVQPAPAADCLAGQRILAAARCRRDRPRKPPRGCDPKLTGKPCGTLAPARRARVNYRLG